jgi:hypothetical protein
MYNPVLFLIHFLQRKSLQRHPYSDRGFNSRFNGPLRQKENKAPFLILEPGLERYK